MTGKSCDERLPQRFSIFTGHAVLRQNPVAEYTRSLSLVGLNGSPTGGPPATPPVSTSRGGEMTTGPVSKDSQNVLHLNAAWGETDHRGASKTDQSTSHVPSVGALPFDCPEPDKRRGDVDAALSCVGPPRKI